MHEVDGAKVAEAFEAEADGGNVNETKYRTQRQTSD